MGGHWRRSRQLRGQDGADSGIRSNNDTRQDTRAASGMASNTEKNAYSGFDEAERLWLRASP